MNRRSSPGAGQWFTVTILVAATIFLLIKLFQYASLRGNYPTGLTVAGVNVGGLNREEATNVLTNRYIEAPVLIYHGQDRFEISPSDAEFELDLETMLSRADIERTQQDFWAGFWGFLWGTPVEVSPVELSATHNREALRRVLGDIAALMDQPTQPAQPVPGTFSFQYGETGTVTNVDASFADVEGALYRAANREARLVVEPSTPDRPQINLLTRLLVNSLQDYEQVTSGAGSMFVMDLNAGVDEIAINADLPMSGMDLLKLPIVLETYRLLDQEPTLTQAGWISSTLSADLSNEGANQLLRFIAGQDDPRLGAQLVTETMQRLGLVNTFIVLPYDGEPPAGTTRPSTPANSVEELRTLPNPYLQTTAEDMGTLLSMLYYCAEGTGGALMAVFEGDVTQTECQTILAFMLQNEIGSLIEEGVPPETAVAHRHGWISDTHGDAGIVFSPGADYVIVLFLYKPDWLEWEISSPLLANLSRATYNYFNFDNPYLTDARTN
ncbi:MAG: serine hydrolase [Anaerolineaceae bacterium]|nr:serine hydrolase [Anaerolineaceae bacterium]